MSSTNFIAFIANELNVPVEGMNVALVRWQNDNLEFSCADAKHMWETHNKPFVIPTGLGGKATKEDIRKLIGEASPSKEPSPWSSPHAKKLAEENGLSATDFPMDDRSGRELKNGYKKISVDDVKKRIGAPTNKFSGPAVAIYADEAKVSLKDFPDKKVVTKTDVDNLIKSRGANTVSAEPKAVEDPKPVKKTVKKNSSEPKAEEPKPSVVEEPKAEGASAVEEPKAEGASAVEEPKPSVVEEPKAEGASAVEEQKMDVDNETPKPVKKVLRRVVKKI